MMKILFNIIVGLILVFASIRGALVCHFGTSPNLTYATSAVMLILLGLYSTCHMIQKRVPHMLYTVKKAFLLNMILIGMYFSLFSVLGGFASNFGLLYIFMVFPVTLILVKWTRIELEIVLFAVFVIHVMGIIIMKFIGMNNISELYRIQTMLRPSQNAISHIGGIPSIGGYQASNHDAANILVMICMYYVIKIFTSNGARRLHYIVISFVGTIALFLTNSAANIIVFLGMSFVAIQVMQKGVFRKIASLMLIFFFILIVLSINSHYFDILLFAGKFAGQKDLPDGGIYNSLDIYSFFYSLPSLLLGFGYQMNVPMVDSEIAFVKIIVSFGLVPSLVLFYILFLPLILLRRVAKATRMLRLQVDQGLLTIPVSKIKYIYNELSLVSAPVIAGTMTLLHYGSLFRVTSIGLYCVLLAIFLKEYVVFMDNFTLCRQVECDKPQFLEQ